MKSKKDLAKIALTALALAAVVPVNGQAFQGSEAKGTYLAGGCQSGGGCGGVSTPAANANVNDKADDYKTADGYYNTQAKGAVTSSSTVTESQLLSSLNPASKAIYNSLDPEGKAVALQLAGQDDYKDKNLAVKEAQRRMNERRGVTNQ